LESHATDGSPLAWKYSRTAPYAEPVTKPFGSVLSCQWLPPSLLHSTRSAPAKGRHRQRPEPECDRRRRDDHEPPADAVSGRRDGDDEEDGGEDGEEASESPALHADDGTISPA
jgi:hypothetical protein